MITAQHAAILSRQCEGVQFYLNTIEEDLRNTFCAAGAVKSFHTFKIVQDAEEKSAQIILVLQSLGYLVEATTHTDPNGGVWHRFDLDWRHCL